MAATKKGMARTCEGLVSMVAHRLFRIEEGRTALKDGDITPDHVDEARALVQRALRLQKIDIANAACPLPDGVEEPTLAMTPAEVADES